MLLRGGWSKATPAPRLPAKLGQPPTVLDVRREIQAHAEQHQLQTPLNDSETETDEMFQERGGKKVTITAIGLIPRVAGQ